RPPAATTARPDEQGPPKPAQGSAARRSRLRALHKRSGPGDVNAMDGRADVGQPARPRGTKPASIRPAGAPVQQGRPPIFTRPEADLSTGQCANPGAGQQACNVQALSGVTGEYDAAGPPS